MESISFCVFASSASSFSRLVTLSFSAAERASIRPGQALTRCNLGIPQTTGWLKSGLNLQLGGCRCTWRGVLKLDGTLNLGGAAWLMVQCTWKIPR